MERFRLVCKTPQGDTIFVITGFETEGQAQVRADEFNQTPGTQNTWVVEPLYYH